MRKASKNRCVKFDIPNQSEISRISKNSILYRILFGYVKKFRYGEIFVLWRFVIARLNLYTYSLCSDFCITCRLGPDSHHHHLHGLTNPLFHSSTAHANIRSDLPLCMRPVASQRQVLLARNVVQATGLKPASALRKLGSSLFERITLTVSQSIVVQKTVAFRRGSSKLPTLSILGTPSSRYVDMPIWGSSARTANPIRISNDFNSRLGIKSSGGNLLVHCTISERYHVSRCLHVNLSDDYGRRGPVNIQSKTSLS